MNSCTRMRAAPRPDGSVAMRARRRWPPRIGWASRALALAAIALMLDGCAWLPPRTAAAPAATITAPTPAATTPPVAEIRGGVDSTPTSAALPPSKVPDKPASRRPLPSGVHETLAPSEVGYYMDVLQGRLSQLLGVDARIQRRGDDIGVAILYAAGFEPGTARVSATGRAQLKPLAEALATFRLTLLAVHVRGDDAGAASAPLGSQRTAAVARYLTDSGVAAKRVVSGSGAVNRLPVVDASPGGVRLEVELTPLTAAHTSTL
jgi:outer membrane protein OmpA-like peptidoglycan-associated protein